MTHNERTKADIIAHFTHGLELAKNGDWQPNEPITQIEGHKALIGDIDLLCRRLSNARQDIIDGFVLSETNALAYHSSFSWHLELGYSAHDVLTQLEFSPAVTRAVINLYSSGQVEGTNLMGYARTDAFRCVGHYVANWLVRLGVIKETATE